MKIGLDFFYCPVSFDDPTQLVEAEFGLKAIAIIVKLKQRIFGGQGYYCDWNDEVALLFGSKVCGLSPGDHAVSEVINAALRRGIFDKKIFDKYGVLTSMEIQRDFLEAAKRRKNVEVKKEYLLLSLPILQDNVIIIDKNVNINGKNVDINEQSKGKGSKGKESNDSCTEPGEPDSMPPVISLPLNDNSEYPITEKEIEVWKELYPSVNILQELRKYKGWALTNPKKRKTRGGILRSVNSWLAKEQDKGGSPQNNSVKQNSNAKPANGVNAIIEEFGLGEDKHE
ncbi:MAG: DUF4373 domain-containing protein [Lachnospiraceae bacterium]|nr:DUF4373 domain-containing protein [Lachnospiraceae bacterium]